MVTRDMTVGSPAKLMLRFAVPLLFGNLFQQLYNMVDAMIVGRALGANALAGVGSTASVQFLVIGFCLGVCSGFGIPVAQRFGAKDYSDMRTYVFQSVMATSALAVIVTLLTTVLTHRILHILKIPADIYDNAYIYLFIIFAGIPFTLLYNLLSSILRAIGDSKTPFIFLIISSFLNIVLDLVFIITLKAGVAGAAIATIIAQAVSGIACLVLIIKKYEILWLKKEDRKYNRKHMLNLIIMGVPMGLQFSITAIGSMVMQAANNSLGSIYVSGFTAGMKIKQLAMCPFDALANAVSTFAGQNYGAGKADRIKQGLKEGILIGIAYGILIGLVLFFFGRTMSILFVSASETEVLDAAGLYLRRLGCFYWALAILNVTRMTTQGLGYSGRAVFSGVSEMIARIAVSVIFVPLFAYDAITFADQAAWVSGCLYIAPTCFYCVRLSAEKIAGKSPKKQA